ncbi:hypothetical protein L596_023988 [Steinernema carpocapsae]|uniref:Uncharacterized protein n=1 Tax=Steinernema carpocapsae TaxID=34508 RepID=A0A4U5MFE1_STECR|nr:hypothetical protein L596_023988 [Steinernema carpocapsae]
MLAKPFSKKRSYLSSDLSSGITSSSLNFKLRILSKESNFISKGAFSCFFTQTPSFLIWNTIPDPSRHHS